MTNKVTYKNYQIFSTQNWNQEIDGFSFTATVFDLKPKSEKDFYFTETSQISSNAIIIKYGEKSDLVAKEIIENAIAKVKTRIDFGLFDKGKVYLQCITSSNLEEKYLQIDDESIQNHLLKGLLNIRKTNPQSYSFSGFDPVGLCEIFKISFDCYLFNAGILMDDNYIDTKIEGGVRKGQIYITSLGVKLISDKIKQQERKIASSILETSKTNNEKYDIAISFAGEDRKLAEQIASKLKEKNVTVFYDDFEKADMWGKNLYDYFSSIYNEKSKYCVMLLSEHYEKKLWTCLERQSAQARAFNENREYILPIRIDKTKITGIPETVAYIDANTHSVDDIIKLILNKLGNI